jgi:2-polyprenyl-6-hydroxyphenyl methylase/3-demethylubiquinone-9 3-methyltransferase
MDYRKPAVFGENWSESRFKVLPYFSVEKTLLMQPGIERILDLGCANGWNMSRFGQYGRSSFGLDIVPERVKLAEEHGPVLVASGLDVPVVDSTFDVVYVQHVLHHIGDVERALKEAWRVLKPGGILFLIETQTGWGTR